MATLLNIASSSPQGTGNVFRSGLDNEWNLKMDSNQYIVKGDLSITLNDKPLVVIEVKYPSLGGSIFENDHHFIQVLTQTTHQCVAAGTPFAAFTDSESAFFFQILVDDPLNTREHLDYCFETAVKGIIQKNDKKKTSGILRPTDRRVGIRMRFRRVHKRDKVSISATLAAFAYEASLMLATEEARSEMKTKLVSLLEKCKLSANDELFRREAEDASLKKKTENIISNMEDKRPEATHQHRNMSKMSKEFTFQTEEWEPLRVSAGWHFRNAQVYRLKKDVFGKLMLPSKWNKSSVILKVYDPNKSPIGWGRELYSWRTRVKIAIHSAQRELWAYCRLKGCLVAPEFIQTGFLKGKDISGPYFLLQDVSGMKPNMESLKDVQQVLESCLELLKRQIVHGDIKSDNVLLCNGSAILLDFGNSFIRTTDGEAAEKSLDELQDDSKELKSKWRNDVFMATKELAHADRNTLTEKFETYFDKVVQPIRENKEGQSSNISPNKKRKSL